MVTAGFVLMFVAGLAAGYTIKAVLVRREYEVTTDVVIDAAVRPPCPVEGCACRDVRGMHLH
jgi:hypothetical protein